MFAPVFARFGWLQVQEQSETADSRPCTTPAGLRPADPRRST